MIFNNKCYVRKARYFISIWWVLQKTKPNKKQFHSKLEGVFCKTSDYATRASCSSHSVSFVTSTIITNRQSRVIYILKHADLNSNWLDLTFVPPGLCTLIPFSSFISNSETTMVYKASSKTAMAIQRKPVFFFLIYLLYILILAPYFISTQFHLPSLIPSLFPPLSPSPQKWGAPPPLSSDLSLPSLIWIVCILFLFGLSRLPHQWELVNEWAPEPILNVAPTLHIMETTRILCCLSTTSEQGGLVPRGPDLLTQLISF